MPALDLWFASGESSLSVRHFKTVERMFGLFEVTIVALSSNDDLNLDALVGKPAAFYIAAGTAHLLKDGRRFTGLCSSMEQIKSETRGLSTYRLQIVPALWQLTQRRNHRTFQHLSIPDIVDQILDEWRIEHTWIIDRPQHPKLELRVQYGETDYDFLRRMLEEAGIAFYFRDGTNERGAVVVLHELPDRGATRDGDPLRHVDTPNSSAATKHEYITEVHIGQQVRPGRVTLSDHDFRCAPEYKLQGQASASTPEDLYEQHVYAPGSFLVEGGTQSGTPIADDYGVARHDEQTGQRLAEQHLEAHRASRRTVSFRTNTLDLAPGVIFSMREHPREDLGPKQMLLVTEFHMEGTPTDDWTIEGKAYFAADAYRPPLATVKPQIHGVESAIIVGPKGEEIHTDEFARVRVHFHWDRYVEFNEQSSCWVRVSQGWAGTGFGMIAIPRVGQEVLVAFLGGNPDQPVIVGRLYNNTSSVPYKLPDNKTMSGWRSDSTPGSQGFNEIMFEDAKGRERMFIQAEKDLQKLVKSDETERTGKKRLIEVGQRLELTTGKASIVIDGANIILDAKGELVFKADKRIVSHGGPLTELNPWSPKHKKRRKIKPPKKLAKVSKKSGAVAVEEIAQGIAVRGSPEFRESTRAALERLEGTPTGRALAKKIARTGHDVVITETKTPNTICYAKDPNNASWQSFGVAGKGSSSVIAYNSNFTPAGQSSDVALGHALVTAWYNGAGKHEEGSTGGVSNQLLKSTGVAPYSKLKPSENRLRKNLGLPPRDDL